MMLMSNKVLILFVCTLNVLQVFCVRDNSAHSTGDQCELDNNQSGVCKEARNCEYAMKLIKERRIGEVLRCQFEGRVPIVCCPQETSAAATTTQEPKTTTQATISSARYPKSHKFLKALCKDIPENIDLDPNIIGGEPAAVGEFPFQVALGYRNKDEIIEYNCGGSLIADDIVLTATHCVNRRGLVPVTVKLGRASLVPDEYDHGDGEDIDIQSIKQHPKYSRFSRHYDIALIKLKQPTKFTWPIETICLSSDDVLLPKNFTISGFGVNDVDTKKKSEWLLKAIVNIHPFLECKELIKYGGKDLVESQFCAIGYKGADSCQGDSGGPVSFKRNGNYYLYGIVSYGMACGGEIPGVYTKINQLLEWIDDEMYKFEIN